MLESELGKKTPLKKTELLTGRPAGLLNYRCQLSGLLLVDRFVRVYLFPHKPC